MYVDCVECFPMSSATVIVCSAALFWLKPVAMVLFMSCSAVLVESLRLNPCCVEMCGYVWRCVELCGVGGLC